MARTVNGRLEAQRSDLRGDVEPISEEERRWLARLERVLKDQPRRLMLVESADSIQIVDRDAAAGVALEDGNAQRNGVWLANVRHSGFKLTGVSG